MSTEQTKKPRGRKPLATKVQDGIKEALANVALAGVTAETWRTLTKDEDAKAALTLAIESCATAIATLGDVNQILGDYAPTDAKDFGFNVGDLVNVRKAHRAALLLAVDDPSELSGASIHKIDGAKIVLRTESGSRLIVRRSQILPVDVAEDENTEEDASSNNSTGDDAAATPAVDVAAQ